MVAYDFETTRIAAGTPRPLWLTAYGIEPSAELQLETYIRDMAHLTRILLEYFLTDELSGVKFVGWNANNFDSYFVAAALVQCEQFVIRPYLTRSNSLRGMKVMRREDVNTPNARSWEFLDGMAMLGLAGVKLEKFLENFAPDYRKLTGAIDFDGGEDFDPENPTHREYAMRDSVGLYHGMVRAQQILLDRFNQPLAVTMGGACIKIFKAHIPRDVIVRTPPDGCLDLIRDYVMRGGFCYCVKRYEGKVWKYDINQAYAAAMRESGLPCGSAFHTSNGVHKFARIYIARVSAVNERNQVPFYCRVDRAGRMRSVFATTRIENTWITSTEVEQLKREGWKLTVHESWTWEDVFSMREYVDKLETGRAAATGGPSGAEGTMFKMVGNHSYGKTVEQLEPVSYILAAECPPGYVPYYGEESDPLEHIYMCFEESTKEKDYHQPQIGAFITAHVRMVVRRAALLAPDAWLYADTDCVVFSRDVTSMLDIDGKRYGAWKVEESGTVYKVIAKKVYAEVPDYEVGPVQLPQLKRSAKGMHAGKLTPDDFAQWYEGTPPEQVQTQRNNFLSVMRGAEMYRSQRRSGTAVEAWHV